MNGMNLSRSPGRIRGFRLVTRVAALTILSFALLSQAMAVETLPERQKIEVQRRTQNLDVPILRQKLRREKFQRKENELREGDRAKDGDLRIDLPVRRMKRNCQVQPFGATFLRNCR